MAGGFQPRAGPRRARRRPRPNRAARPARSACRAARRSRPSPAPRRDRRRAAPSLSTPSLSEERERILRDVVAVAVVDMDAVLGDLDAEILVAHLARHRCDLLGRLRKRPARMQREQRRGVALRQIRARRGGEHDAAREIVLLDGAARMRAHLHHQHVADVQLRGDAQQHRGDAGRVGVGQLGQIAGAHQHLGLGPLAAQLGVALERGGEAEMDRIEHRVGKICAASWRRARPWRGRASPDRRAPWGSAPGRLDLVGEAQRRPR